MTVQASDKDVKLPPVQFFLAQILTLTPTSVLLWGTGVLWLLFAKSTRSYRFLASSISSFLG